MPTLFDLGRGREIGTIGAEELAYLRSKLEEDSPTDLDYYLTRDTLAGFETEGEEPPKRLYQLLSIAMGPDDEIDIGISDVDASRPYRLRGRLVDVDGPCPACKVEVFTHDSELLGAVLSGSDGRFLLTFDEPPASPAVVVSRWEVDCFAEAGRFRPGPGSEPDHDLGDVTV